MIVYITCSADDAREEMAVNAVKQFVKFNKRLIILGCLPGINLGRLHRIHKGEHLSTKEIDDIDQFFPEFTVPFSQILDANEYKETPTRRQLNAEFNLSLKYLKQLWNGARYVFKTRMLRKNDPPVFPVRVAWGCLGGCTYCAIPMAIGKLKSKPIADCIFEIKTGYDKSYRHFNFHADDVGAYGTDLGVSLPDLLDQAISVAPDAKFNLWELHPHWLLKYPEKVATYIENRNVDYLWIPLQTGSSRLLSRMGRATDLNLLQTTLKQYRNINIAITLWTNIIIGFPGEEDQDLEETIKYISESKFDLVVIYPYSAKKGTKAATFTEHIDKKTIKKRCRMVKRKLRASGVQCYIDIYNE